MARKPTKAARSAAQSEASKVNGRHSAGPTTSEGRAISAANALRTGLFSSAVAVPGEDLEQAKANIRGWLGSFPVRSFAASQLAGRAAIAAMQLERADRLREKVLAEVLERVVAACAANKALAHARETREAVAGLAILAEEIRAPVPGERAARLATPIQRVVQAVLELDVPTTLGHPLALIAGALEADDVYEVPVAIFAELAKTSREILGAIDDALPRLLQAVEQERKRQAEMLIVADDPRLKQIDRVCGRLLKQMDQTFRAMASLRQVEAIESEAANDVLVPVVEFRVIGGAVR